MTTVNGNRIGRSSYQDAVQYSKKNLIICSSVVKGLRMKELNQCLTNSFSKVRSFPSAKKNQTTELLCCSLTHR